ncbi:hypothetical protein OG520_37685 [Streptomyces sp. NBC_00984]|uniref:hypothetical protein n=1 Tax=Streptomyces sp. NBC_00984 TaxID=2903700 RepID=UPI00386721EF|nr:hypothetical protein OG520_37685 [Streptomyces sp. NBC_00984]
MRPGRPRLDGSTSAKAGQPSGLGVDSSLGVDSGLGVDSAVRLAGDADHSVQHSARQNPALPSDVLISLLLDEHSAEDAAQNPSIPTAVMHRMVALAAIPEREPGR